MKLTVQVKLQALPEQAIPAENIRRAAVNQPDVPGVDVSGVLHKRVAKRSQGADHLTRRTRLTKERRQRRCAAIPQAVREDWDLLVPFFLHIGQGMLPCFLDARVDLATWFALARSAVGRQASFTQVAI